jgi:hypothetical protein
MVSVAQLAEHWVVAPVVVGSSPITHPRKVFRYSYSIYYSPFQSPRGRHLLSTFIHEMHTRVGLQKLRPAVQADQSNPF